MKHVDFLASLYFIMCTISCAEQSDTDEEMTPSITDGETIQSGTDVDEETTPSITDGETKQSSTEGEDPLSCLCFEIAPLFPIRAEVTDIGPEYVALITESYPVSISEPIETGVAEPPDASTPDDATLAWYLSDDSIPEIGQAFGGSWDGSPICGFGCVRIDVGDEVLVYFEREELTQCPEYIACFDEKCSPNEDSDSSFDVCNDSCLAQTSEACAKREEEAWLNGSLKLAPWDDALIVGVNENTNNIASITPDELITLHDTFANDYESCNKHFPNVALELYRTGQKSAITNKSPQVTAIAESSPKCQFSRE